MPIEIPQGDITKATGPAGEFAKITGSGGVIFQLVVIPDVDGVAQYSTYSIGTVVGGMSTGFSHGTRVFTPATGPTDEMDLLQTGTAPTTQNFSGATRTDTRTCDFVSGQSGSGVAGTCNGNAIGTTDTRVVMNLTRSASVTPTVANGGITTRTIDNPAYIAQGPTAVIQVSTTDVEVFSTLQFTDASTAGDAPIATSVWAVASGGGTITQAGFYAAGDDEGPVHITLLVTDTAGLFDDAAQVIQVDFPPFEFDDIDLLGVMSIDSSTGGLTVPATFASGQFDIEGFPITFELSLQPGQITSFPTFTSGTEIRMVSVIVIGEVPTRFSGSPGSFNLQGVVGVNQQALLPRYFFDGSIVVSQIGRASFTDDGTAINPIFVCPQTDAIECGVREVQYNSVSGEVDRNVEIQYTIPQNFLFGGTTTTEIIRATQGAQAVDGTAQYDSGSSSSTGGTPSSSEVNVSGYGPAPNTIPVGVPFTQTETYNIRTNITERITTTTFTCVVITNPSNGGAVGTCSSPPNDIDGTYTTQSTTPSSSSTGSQLSRDRPSVGTLQPSAVNGTAEYSDGVDTSEGGGSTDVEINLSGYLPDPSTIALGAPFTQTETYNIRTDIAARVDTTTFTCVLLTPPQNGGAAGTCSSPPNDIDGTYADTTNIPASSSTGVQQSRDQQSVGTMPAAATLTVSIGGTGSVITDYDATVGGTATGNISYSWSAGGQASGSSSGTASAVPDFSPNSGGGRGAFSISLTITRGGITKSATFNGFNSQN